MELGKEASSFEAAGYPLTAVTAEPGGAARVKERLAERDVAELPFGVLSDPSLATVGALAPRDAIYVIEYIDVNAMLLKFNAMREGSDYEAYEMVQPAVAVCDTNGAVRTWWSWKKYDDEVSVNLRPISADILAAATGGRDIKSENVI